MMAKRKNDDVEEEDSISDDLLNQHYDELEKQQYGGEISNDQLKTWVWNNQVALSLNLNFKMLDSQKIGKRQRINKDTKKHGISHQTKESKVCLPRTQTPG